MAVNIFRRRPDVDAATIQGFYGAIVAQAREPAFYADYGVPDTVEGRFDMIVLHLALLLRRLRSEPPALRRLGQGVFDAFCTDMDANLREMGLSDAAVPRRMRGFGEAFYGRASAYDRAFDAHDEAALADALGRNILRAEGAAGALALCGYMHAAERALAAQSPAQLAQGILRFPPALMAPSEPT
jgi:cytochrome b pre-mRNA-processing protein 3